MSLVAYSTVGCYVILSRGSTGSNLLGSAFSAYRPRRFVWCMFLFLVPYWSLTVMFHDEQTNVLVDADRRACVTDFGLSVILLTRPEGTTSGFATGLRAKGTLRWMAPELLGLDGSYITPSAQSDVYSFGSIVLQLCNICPTYCFALSC